MVRSRKATRVLFFSFIEIQIGLKILIASQAPVVTQTQNNLRLGSVSKLWLSVSILWSLSIHSHRGLCLVAMAAGCLAARCCLTEEPSWLVSSIRLYPTNLYPNNTSCGKVSGTVFRFKTKSHLALNQQMFKRNWGLVWLTF